MTKLFRPDRSQPFEISTTQKYLSNLVIEMEKTQFTSEEQSFLRSKQITGRLLDDSTRPYFYYHFGPLITKAVNSLFAEKQKPLILDLGCGSGMASILFGLLGAQVIGIDMNPVAIEVCHKRLSIYEKTVGPLDVKFYADNIFDFKLSDLGPIDGVYSLFAFNLMQPSKELLGRLLPNIRTRGKIIISDGNLDSLYNRLVRPRAVLIPDQLVSSLTEASCRTLSLDFHCIVPPVMAANGLLLHLGAGMERALDKLKLLRWLGISYTIVAERL